jgi:hypothetical protein
MKNQLILKSRPIVCPKSIEIVAIFLLALASFVVPGCKGHTDEAGVALQTGFQTPPEVAKPRLWWHWMNGNITREGIKEDLEWMVRVGFGGFQNFDAAWSTPQIVEKRLAYMTPEWKDAFLFTTRLADSMGLEMAIAGSPGWSESGGPWVAPAQAMKKLVWSEIRATGGHRFTGILPKPPTTTGKFQNVGASDIPGLVVGEHKPAPEFYSDVAVVAFRAPEQDGYLADMKPNVTSSAGKMNLKTLTDGDLAKSVFLPAGQPKGKSWIQYEFSKPVTIQSLTLVTDGGETAGQTLEASDDGRQYKGLLDIYLGSATQNTITFQPATARFFRVTFTTPSPQAARAGTRIAELVLHSVARVNRFEDKAGFTSASGLFAMATPPVSAPNIINKNEVVVLTSKMKPDGSLDWTPPDGNWVILRFGYSLTGKTNHPASPEATGLEVDKLSAEHVKAYFNNYLDQYKDATGGLMGRKGLQYVITDSWEAGVQNWTDSMRTEFTRRRGYDILPWLPVITGRVVESAEASDRFLWDFRKTIADLTAENHYDQLTTLLHNRGMGRYTESHEGGRAFIADGMEVKRNADIPMSALWTPNEVGGSIATVYKADVRESASVAHLYGQNLVAAESMTSYGSPWAWSPESLKPTADMELANGVNRFVVSVSVHSPSNDKLPGLSLGPFGPWLNRHETWAEQAKPWITYLTRSSYMLQQGRFIADIIYFYGEDNNITSLFANKLPEVPEGYNYDFVNADALVKILSVNKGQIITPGGMHYLVLALDPNCKYMSLPVLRKISKMVQDGAVVVGDKPVGTPSLSDDKAIFKEMADQVWGMGKGERTFGKGKVYSGLTITEVMASMKIKPDFKYIKPQQNTELLFVHRKADDADIYWVNNRNNRVENLEAIFRVDGKTPEIWHPETGMIEAVSYTMADQRTTVTLKLEPNDAVFVVFRKKAVLSSLRLTQPAEKQLAVIEGPWDVSFQPGRGAPAHIVLNELASWSESNNAGIKYFSGTGSYQKTIQVSTDWLKDSAKIFLDLGIVKNLAEVMINGKRIGIVWKTPFRINITGALKTGDNTLEIKITNLWVNRMIGDRQPGNLKKITYTTMDFYEAHSPLLPSGLLGPVEIVRLSNN